MFTYLITGCAGFIGFSLAKKLLEQGIDIIGVDNLNDYYDQTLKKDRLAILEKYENFSFLYDDITNDSIEKIFQNKKINLVVNLAAQAGVRYSIDHPEKYIESNIVGFANILEFCRQYNVDKIIYASSSSVYGMNKKIPFSEYDNVDHPISLYAATKKSNELMAYTYSHIFNLKTIGLRFFTVYGPWGRPDMALFKFVKNILNNQAIQVYNYGNLSRDFTYIDDIVDGIEKCIINLMRFNQADSGYYKIYNIGNNQPVKLKEFISVIENKLDKKAILDFQDMQPGDVLSTYADITEISKDLNYHPKTNINEGIEKFISWYRSYFNC